MGGQPDTRWCKFGGIECSWSDRGRADCYVCSAMRAKLSTLSRLQRENRQLVIDLHEAQGEIDRLHGELMELQQKHDKLVEERDKAWHLVIKLRRQVAAA